MKKQQKTKTTKHQKTKKTSKKHKKHEKRKKYQKTKTRKHLITSPSLTKSPSSRPKVGGYEPTAGRFSSIDTDKQ